MCVFTHLFIFGSAESFLLPVAFLQLLASWATLVVEHGL